MRKSGGIEWQLDLKPARRVERARTEAAVAPLPSTPPTTNASPAPALPTEVLEALNDLRRKVNHLNTRLQVAERALAELGQGSPAPTAVPAPAAVAEPDADADVHPAVKVAARRTRAPRVRRSSPPAGMPTTDAAAADPEDQAS